MGTSSPAVEVENVVKVFGGNRALDGVSFSVSPGSICGFIGPNGAGKTTMLRILATLLKPDSGKVRVLEYDATHYYQAKQLRLCIGYMPDTFGLYPDMTPTEYLEFFAAAYRIPKEDRSTLVKEILSIIGLESYATVLIGTMSRGMQQRISLGRCLVHAPKLLLLDEPASGLDPRARIELMELLKELKEMGKTIILSSHILAELHLLCDEIVLIDHGRIRFHGSIAEARRQLRPHFAYVRINWIGDRETGQKILEDSGWIKSLKTTPEGDYILQLSDGVRIPDLIRYCVQNQLELIKVVEDEPHLGDIFLYFTEEK